MDISGRSAPFSTRGVGVGPIVPPPQGIVFGRAAAAAKAGGSQTSQNGQSTSGSGHFAQTAQTHNPSSSRQNAGNRKVSPARVRKAAPAVTHPVLKQPALGATAKDFESQREAQAKARRLLRFAQGGETSDDSLQRSNDRPSGRSEDRLPSREIRQVKVDVRGQLRAEAPRKIQGISIENALDESMEAEGGDAAGDDFSNTEAIVGTCSDMCPESERQERERKGDLDRFERVDGDRNLTSVGLAVKKYTRTPSREPHMIRPLPILEMTMDHLLTLIDRGYGEGLLNIHSFLWDRMRAVRMDLRMQHIFNREAITMHEQMIRFHILAMHELCQYKKGEGFNEGFDAHLNIEQMNKASVDLFEMYDDHRKRGIPVDTEAEFRGYYALLKLDKHPGYSVEPAELSLDLAKMTSEMRNTSQVLFARDVARACRGGNYIAFFRLARKATYLQACLMHAHFSKLRTEALASLHSGLQRNQGVPITLVVKWLGMEGEDIESLVEYHGFSLKLFEKLYAVKEGPFLNRDTDYEAQRSRLVESKHSPTVVADVEGKGQLQAVAENWAASPLTPVIQEEEMPDYEEEELPSPVEPSFTVRGDEVWAANLGSSTYEQDQTVEDMRISPPFKIASPPVVLKDSGFKQGNYSPRGLLWPTQQQSYSPVNFQTESSPQKSRKRESYSGRLSEDGDLKEGNKKLVTEVGAIAVEVEEEEDDLPETGPTMEEMRARKVLEWEVEKEEEREKERERERRLRVTEEAEAAAAKWAAKLAAAAESKRLELEEQKLAYHRAEASAGKKRIWLRRWKRRAALRAEEKLRRKMRAEAALSSLSAGPPLAGPQLDEGQALLVQAEHYSAVITVDQVARKRAEKLREMWNPIDVASLVVPLLEHKSPSSRFITFKLLLSVGGTDVANTAGQWLSSKLAGTQLLLPEVHAEGRSPGFWFQAKDIDTRNESEGQSAAFGASGLVFLVRKGQAISKERARLHAIVEALPVGARLPLLLLYTPQEAQVEVETEKLKESLGLLDFEGLKIGWQNVSPVTSSAHGGLYKDGFLKGGLVWLANSIPPQPNLRPVHVRDLVNCNLDGHSKILMASTPSSVTPDRCVTIFNCALRSAAMEIRKAVGSAPPHWPPEEAQSDVSTLLPGLLPQQRWNEPDALDPILRALEVAELPRFPVMENIRPGSPTSAWEHVRHQKVAVERALQDYLVLVDETTHATAATRRQAQLMVQRSCALEWTESGRVLVPRWANIFQSIYQTRLLLLNSEPPPTVYVVAKGDEDRQRPLELDEIEKVVPYATEIAAGSPFGVPKNIAIMFDELEEQEVRASFDKNRSLVESGKGRYHFQADMCKTADAETEEVGVFNREELTPSHLWEPPWSIFSPSSDVWQRDFQPSSSKKRRLALSSESARNSSPTESSNFFASPTVWAHGDSMNALQSPDTIGGSQVESEDEPFQVRQRVEIPLTAEEIEIENIVAKIHTDMDRSTRRASSDMCFADIQFRSDFHVKESVPQHGIFLNRSLSVWSERRIGEQMDSLSLNGRMQNLDDLLKQCQRAQDGVDQKLENSFGVQSPTMWTGVA